MKRALVVGINHYENVSSLEGCINDAIQIAELMRTHDDDSPNFDVKVATSENNNNITRKTLGILLQELLTRPADMAFFYFAGHGTMTNLGGYLCTYEAEEYNEGVPMQDLLALVNKSPIKEIVIILDCCHSGNLGSIPSLPVNGISSIKEGVSILAACRDDEASLENRGSGFFTSLVCDALSGGAADIQGIVTPAGIYSHVEQSFGAWDQRPLFKSYVSRSTPIRKTFPKISLEDLRQLPYLFPHKNEQYYLDRSHEHTESSAIQENVKKFQVLKKLQTVGLIRVNRESEPDLYWACLENNSCELSPLGKFYWELALSKKI